MKNKNGFTLLEMLIAVFVIASGLVAVMSLMQWAIVSAQISSSRLTAAYLAQEGIEIVRNIRDSNRLLQQENPGIPWDQSLLEGNWEVDFDDFNFTSYQGRNLRVNGGFYNYASGPTTKFKRRVSIQKPNQDILNISVEVTWSEREAPYSLSIQENLYNWR